MKDYGFTSAFAPELNRYLAFKENMGFYGSSRIWYLKRFDRYCVEHGRDVFDQTTVEGWVAGQLQRSDRFRSWMSYIRDVGRWLVAEGNESAYVLSDQWRAPFVPARPYLLSRREIDAFFGAATVFRARSPWQWQAVAFFTLMHSCGMRTGEVRALLSEHVDLNHGHLDVVKSKGNRSRRLPLTEEVIEILRSCDRISRQHVGPSRATFFVSGTNNQVTPSAVGVVFNRIWDRAGLARALQGPRPRPYDFRHHFAYANVERWRRDGREVTALLAYLSRYMGHATFESTYYYIHTSPDFMDAYAQIAQKSEELLPEVGFE
ncbi:MAG: tyrosine-type recombinase/integrase [Acidimicrobiales bacterium]